MDALLTLQPAIDRGEVRLQRTAHKDLGVMLDYPKGEMRTTYAALEDGIVQCIVQFVHADPVEGVPCLSLGVATMEKARNRGLAKDTMTKAIEEMRVGLARHGIKRFYLEAIVSKSNVPSQKVATRILAAEPTSEGTDHESGEPIFQYLKLITS